jgi:hypothetical protein
MVLIEVLAIFILVMAATLFVFGMGYKLGMHQAKDILIEELKKHQKNIENQNVR